MKRPTINIGRPGPFGNPFRIGRDGTRAEVVEKFQVWFYEPEQLAFRIRVGEELVGVSRWCPGCRDTSPCHGDIYKEYLARKP